MCFERFQSIGLNHDKVLKQFIPLLASNDVIPSQTINVDHLEQSNRTEVESSISTKSSAIADNSQILHVNVTYGPISSTTPTPSETGDLDKGQTLLTSFFKKVVRSEKVERVTTNESGELVTNTRVTDTTDISEYLPDPLEESDDDDKNCEERHCGQPPCLLRLRNQINRKYRRLAKQKYLLRLRIVKNLIYIVQKARHTFCNHWNRFRQSLYVQFVYKCILTYHHLTKALNKQLKNSKKAMQNVNVNEKMTSTESIMINRRVQRLLNDKDQLADDNATHSGGGGTNVPATDSMNKRLPKNQRANDSTKLLLGDNVHDSSEKDFREYFQVNAFFPACSISMTKFLECQSILLHAKSHLHASFSFFMQKIIFCEFLFDSFSVCSTFHGPC